jgi:hypothetical protein
MNPPGGARSRVRLPLRGAARFARHWQRQKQIVGGMLQQHRRDGMFWMRNHSRSSAAKLRNIPSRGRARRNRKVSVPFLAGVAYTGSPSYTGAAWHPSTTVRAGASHQKGAESGANSPIWGISVGAIE